MMRDPNRRSLSAFFYPGIHHNSKCSNTQDVCFLEYVSNSKWSNIAVKMMSGGYAYSSDPTCVKEGQCKHSLELATKNLELLLFMGVAELWELSMLLLHVKLPTALPLLSEFRASTDSTSGTRQHASNASSSSSSFKTTALVKYAVQLEKQNGLDKVLYKSVLQNFCRDLHSLRLWEHDSVQAYWGDKSPFRTEQCP